MHRLSRQVRFSMDPFGTEERQGFNSYAGKPRAEGLGLFFSLTVELEGRIHPPTGFIVNVSEIDACVRKNAVPYLILQIRTQYANQKNISMKQAGQWLPEVAEKLDHCFSDCRLCRLTLNWTPFQWITCDLENPGMIEYTEQFEFAAMHRLWNDNYIEEKNFREFGKCANPAGHGHNYILDVSVRLSGETDDSGWIGQFGQTVQQHFLELVDHKNLNADVPHFRSVNPTVENIASFAWDCLNGKIQGADLSEITVWENDRTRCTYRP